VSATGLSRTPQAPACASPGELAGGRRATRSQPEERKYHYLSASSTLEELAGYAHRRYAVEQFHAEAKRVIQNSRPDSISVLRAHHASVLRIDGKWQHRGVECRVERQVASFGTVSDAVRTADQRRRRPLARSRLLDEGEHAGERATD
jgi:hypothetical protein